MLRPQQLAHAVEALDLGAVYVGLELVGEPPCLTRRGHPLRRGSDGAAPHRRSAASAVTTRSSTGRGAPFPPSPSVEDEGCGLRLLPLLPCLISCGGRLELASSAAVWPSGPSAFRACVAGATPWLPPVTPWLPPVPPLPVSRELLPPPFGTTSVYWSPSVEPGGTVTRCARSRRRQDQRRHHAQDRDSLQPLQGTPHLHIVSLPRNRGFIEEQDRGGARRAEGKPGRPGDLARYRLS